MDKELFEAGLAVRREVVGAEHIDNMMKNADEFNRPMQELVTEYCWGAVWTRPGLDRRSRSILNIGMLAAANRPDELAAHIRGAIVNGVTKSEIQECLLQAAVYLGVPVGLGAFRIAKKIFDELGI